MWRAGLQRMGITLALSFAVHAALLVYLASRRPVPLPPPPPATSLTIEYVEPKKAPPVPEQKPVEKNAEVKPAPAPKKRVAQVEKGPVQELPPTVENTPTTNDLPATEDAPRDIPRQVSLTPALNTDAPSTSDFPVIVREVPAQKTPDELVKGLVTDSISRGKVDRGLVHPYYQQLGKTLLKHWDADRAVSRNGLKGFVEQAVENNRVYAQVWQNRAEEYGSTGSPLGKEEYLNPERPIVGDPSLYARKQLAMKMREQFRASRRALFRVTQDREGKLLSVELIQPSNDQTLDREAMEDVRIAAANLPSPPPEAIGTREKLVSLWQFELIISISPPVPSFSFEFDEALQFVDARMPLDRRIYKRVRLIAAE